MVTHSLPLVLLVWGVDQASPGLGRFFWALAVLGIPGDLCSKGPLVLNTRCSQQMRLLTAVLSPGLGEHELFA
jgi:hypothetical protein